MHSYEHLSLVRRGLAARQRSALTLSRLEQDKPIRHRETVVA